MGCNMKKIIISPPFSNILNFGITTCIVGTYTFKRRLGLWRVLSTLRCTKGGWYNRVGLRNPGICRFRGSGIVSIAGLEVGDLERMIYILSGNKKVLGIEFNISCPNASVDQVNSDLIKLANTFFDYVIVKLPHLISREEILRYADMGDVILHISNSKPTVRGALSGKQLVSLNLSNIRYIKANRPETKVIGGGGIYDIETLRRYESAGADYFSISTILLNPFKTYKLIKSYYG